MRLIRFVPAPEKFVMAIGAGPQCRAHLGRVEAGDDQSVQRVLVKVDQRCLRRSPRGPLDSQEGEVGQRFIGRDLRPGET